MFIFEVGSTTLFALGIKAKQDAWIAILIALIIGLFFIWVYTEIQKAFPKKNYIDIIIIVLGKPIGIPLALLYAVYWLWPAARNLREFGEMIIITSLPETPLKVVLFIFILISVYGLLKGFEVFGRTSEIIMPLILFFLISLYILIYASGWVELSRLKPILGEGIEPVLKLAYPNIAIFPFGEIFVFSLYWCNCNDMNGIRKITMLAAISTGILLTVSLIIDVTVLGVDYASRATIPFVEVIRMIRIGKIITNIDALGVAIIFLGGYYKMSLLLNAVVVVLVTVFKKLNYKATLIFTSIFLLIVAIIFEPSYAYHQWMTPFDTIYFYMPFLHIIPVLVLIIYWIKKKRGVL
jgi:spore germination protein KB